MVEQCQEEQQNGGNITLYKPIKDQNMLLYNSNRQFIVGITEMVVVSPTFVVMQQV